ncbi:MAG: DUF3280 domain-containing protein [Fibromonadales bacterium]|nr:DUF3280 domain-containing protein [Fibromonadales bacterium]
MVKHLQIGFLNPVGIAKFNPGNPKIQKIVVQTIIATLLAITSTTAQIVAVLEIVPSSEEADLTITEFRHLTDELRTQAREALPRNYSILTRDNIIQLLPPESDKSQCFDESCAVEIGRAIGAEYVTQGFVGKFQGMLTLTIELYESMSGNMLGSFVTESNDARGLLGTIRERAPNLFARIAPSLSEPRFSGLKDGQDLNNSVNPVNSVNSGSDKKQRNSPFFIALTLDILGATALGFGAYQQIQANKLNSDYKKMAKEPPGTYSNGERDSALKKANDARSLGNIGLIAGGVLLASGITVHIWF